MAKECLCIWSNSMIFAELFQAPLQYLYTNYAKPLSYTYMSPLQSASTQSYAVTHRNVGTPP